MSLFRYNPEIHDHPEFRDRRHGYDPNQPRVPAGHSDGGQWTSEVGSNAGLDAQAKASPDELKAASGENSGAPRVQLAFAPVPVIVAAEVAAEAAAAVLARAAGAIVGYAVGTFTARGLRKSKNTDEEPLAEFRAYRFTKYGNDPKGKIDFSSSTRVSPQEIERSCRAFADVQSYVDEAAERVNAREREDGELLSKTRYGTEVHKDTKDQVDKLEEGGENRYNISAEVTFLKGAPADYGTKDAVRVDVWEPRRVIKTICLYDPKTGESPRNIITPARAAELAEHSFLKGYTRLYIIELRPNVRRNPPFP